MVLQYLSSRLPRQQKKNKQRTVSEQVEELLASITTSSRGHNHHDYYIHLLKQIQQYPTEVIHGCHDPMGNTILHILLSSQHHYLKSDTFQQHDIDSSFDRNDTNYSYDDDTDIKNISTMDTTLSTSFSTSVLSEEDNIISALEEEVDSFNSLTSTRRWSTCRHESPDVDSGDNRVLNRQQVQEQEKYQHIEMKNTSINNRDGYASSYKRVQLLHIIKYVVEQCSMENMNGDASGGSNVDDENYNKLTSSMTYNFVQQKSVSGDLPLHVACRCSYMNSTEQFEIIQYLLHIYPFAVQCPDIHCNLPIHVACSNSVDSLEILVLLVQNYPESIHIPNMDGNLPLHLASVSSSFRSTIHAEPSEQASQKSDGNESFLTFDYEENIVNQQQKERRQLEIVQYLVGYWPESIYVTNQQHQTALQLAMDPNNNCKNISVIKFLESILREKSITTNTINPFDGDSDIEYTTKPSANPFETDSVIDAAYIEESQEHIFTDANFPDLYAEELIVSIPNDSNYGTDSDYDDTTTGADVVELVEDYFEVVVDRIDHDEENDQYINNNDNDIGIHNTTGSDVYDALLLSECMDRFVVPIR